jgi:nucleotide-binding universal stress UspA family protein
MKKILIPTDFSAPAENSAKYAISMAKVLDAQVTIVNAFVLPVPVSESGLWPVMDTADLERNIGGELDLMVKKLLDDSCTDEPASCPKVDYRCAEGPVLAVIEQISEQINTDLIVMGLSGAGGLVNFILGSNSMAMIEKGDRPVLLIPFGARYHGIKKIVYAGSLTPQDIKPLEYLCKLASWFKAEVCVLHIIEMRKDLNTGMQAIGEDFIDQIRILTSYSKIRYEPVWNSDIDQGLEWIAEQEDIDIVSMLHRKHNILDKIFSGSRTKRFARYTTTPLLVFPPAYIEKKA